MEWLLENLARYADLRHCRILRQLIGRKNYQTSPPAKVCYRDNPMVMQLSLDKYPRLSAFRRRHLPRRYLLNAADYVRDIPDTIDAAVHPAVWTH